MDIRLLLLLFSVFTLSGSGYGQKGNFSHYSLKEGLSQSQVFALCQDSVGHIWAGTQGGGISKFDGTKFEVIGQKQGLYSGIVNCLYTASDGNVWVGTPVGFQILTQKGVAAGKQDLNVLCFEQVADKMYIGASDGLYISDLKIKKSEKFSGNTLPKNVAVNDLAKIGNWLFAATEKGLYRSMANDNKFTRISGLPFPNIQKILPDDLGYLWLAVVGYGLIKTDISSGAVISVFEDPALRYPLDLLHPNSRELWVATENEGLVILDICTDQITHLTEDNSLRTDRLRCLIQDDWNNIWIGTSGEGMIRHTDQEFNYFNLYDYGFGGNRIYSATADKNGGIWLSVNQGLLGYYDGSRFSIYEPEIPFPTVKVRSLATDQFDRLWIGTEGKGLYIRDSAGIADVSEWVPARDFSVIRIVEGSDNEMWVATQKNGIYSLKVSQEKTLQEMSSYTVANGLSDQYVNSIAYDKKGRKLWFGCRNGQAGNIDSDGKIVVFGPKHGLPASPVKTLCLDSTGRIFLAVALHGVFTEHSSDKGSKFVNLEPPDGVKYSTNIYSIQTDLSGHLWLGCENGAYKCTPDSTLSRFQAIRHFDSDDGFMGIENCHNSICLTSYGDLWFGTLNGLVMHRNQSTMFSLKPPKLRIDDILLFNKQINETPYKNSFSFDTLKTISPGLPYHQNHISVIFNAVHQNYPDKVKYRYMLGGADSYWSEWSDQTRINFSSLPPGMYQFRVQASHDSHQISNTCGFAFRIEQPFWQSMWFRVLGAFSVLSVVVGIFISREKSLKRKAREQKEKLELANNLLSLEQKALQLQMNPHFIFNALNSIQSLVASNKGSEARTQIQNFAGMMRSLLNNSRKTSVSMAEEIKYLEQYLSMEQFCQRSGFDYIINDNGISDQDDILLPPMLIQPYVENAVIHGISHLTTRRGKILVEFRLNDQHLICTVTDNGVGRTKARELSANKQNNHVSTGMEVTRQRLAAVAGIEGSVVISDIKNEEGNASGTSVILTIPIQFSY